MSISERPPGSSSSASRGAPPSVPSGSFPNAAYWLIVGGAEDDSSRGFRSRRGAGVEVLSLDLADGRVLPVFGSEESAARFAQSWIANAAFTDPVVENPERDKSSTSGVGGEWLPRGTGAGELISLLSGSAFSAGPCGGVERVAPDPPLELADGIGHGLTEGHVGELVSMSRGCFLERLMGRGRTWFESKEQGESL